MILSVTGVESVSIWLPVCVPDSLPICSCVVNCSSVDKAVRIRIGCMMNPRFQYESPKYFRLLLTNFHFFFSLLPVCLFIRLSVYLSVCLGLIACLLVDLSIYSSRFLEVFATSGVEGRAGGNTSLLRCFIFA